MEVELDEGKLIGYQVTGQHFQIFKQVPYAKAPTGNACELENSHFLVLFFRFFFCSEMHSFSRKLSQGHVDLKNQSQSEILKVEYTILSP